MANIGGEPVLILKEGTERTQGRARKKNKYPCSDWPFVKQ